MRDIMLGARRSVDGQYQFTWVELLCWLEEEGARLPSRPGQAGLTPQLDYALSTLRRQVRRVATAHVAPAVATAFLEPVKGCQRLGELGVRTAVGAIRACPALSDAQRERVRSRVLQLLAPPARGQRRLPTSQRLPWRTADAPEAPPAAPASGPYRLECSTCHSELTLPDRPVRLGRGWPKLRCIACGQLSRCGAAVVRCCRMALMDCSCTFSQGTWCSDQPVAAVAPARGPGPLFAAFARAAASGAT